MAVEKVKYIKDSSTSGFAVAGDEKSIIKPDANKIKKDAEQGNTNKLTQSQADLLERFVDYDSIEYSAEERRNVGRRAINTDGVGNTNGWQTAGAMTGGGAGSIGGGVGVLKSKGMFDIEMKPTKSGGGATQGSGGTEGSGTTQGSGGTEGSGATQSGGGAEGGGGDNVGQDVQKGAEKENQQCEIPWMALVGGAIALATGVLAKLGVSKFDNQYKDRMQQFNAAGDTNATLQSNYDKMGSDMDAMNEESEQFIELLGAKTQNYMDTNAQIAQLQAQYNVYAAQGNKEMADQIMSQIKGLQEGDEGGEDDELTAIQEKMEEYSCSNAEALGVAESGNTVSEFLKDGKAMGILGYVQGGLMTIGALLMLKGTLSAVSAASKVPWPGNIAAFVVAAAGAAMVVAGNAMVAMAAIAMFGKAKDELNCASAGDEMAANVATLQENIAAQADFAATASGQYEEGNAAYEETVAEGEEGLKEGGQQQGAILNGIMNPNDNGNGKKPPEGDK